MTRLYKTNNFLFLVLILTFIIGGTNIMTAQTDTLPAGDLGVSSYEYSEYSDYDSTYSSAEAWDAITAFSAGFWIPTGAANTLGTKLQLGCLIGGKRCKFEIYGTALLRLFPASNEYTYEIDGEQFSTTNYLGWYLGLDFGYEILYYRRNGILLLAGMGLDGFSATPMSEESEELFNINSFNFNIGVGYRHYRRKNNYSFFEFDFKYNFIDYKNPGGTDLSGNAMSFLFLYGVLL